MVRPFSAVPDLLRHVRDAGLRIAIRSSAKEDELDKYLDIACITDLVGRRLLKMPKNPSRQRTSSKSS
jgi:phosphoglycolate phosphatase-like HAD superfamily hydrolase